MRALRFFFFVLGIGACLYMGANHVSQWPIYGALSERQEPLLSPEIKAIVSQNYRPLGHGRQMIAFESEDGFWVVKFFNHRYFTKPFWTRGLRLRCDKWELRKFFAQTSYRVAQKEMPEETQIVALYLGSSAETLPRLRVGSCFVDLNRAPFVVQRKGDLLYQTLLTLSPEKFDAMIEDFLSLIARRMAKNIYDDDKHVEGNFGVVEGRLIQIDPGRFFFDERPPRPPEIEWERATRELYAWLKTQDKERLTAFEKAMEKHCPGIYK